MRCDAEDCIAPSLHTVTEQGVPIAYFCEEHWKALNERLDHFGEQHQALIARGVAPAMADRIVSASIDRWQPAG